MTVSFIGTSLGSFIGLYVWARAGWKGVCVTGMVLASLAFVIFSLTYRKAKNVKSLAV